MEQFCSTVVNEFGYKYGCGEIATKEITVKTEIPHLDCKVKTKTRIFCNHHAKRYVRRLRDSQKSGYRGKKEWTVKELLN